MARPSVAIIVPVYNDSSGIRTTIESLQPHLDTESVNLYVVDNGSTDSTPSVIEAYAKDSEVIVHLSETEIQSSYAARNTGIQHSDANVLAFLDADMTVSKEWLEIALASFEKKSTDYMASDVELTLPERSTLAARYDHHTGFPVEQYIERQHFAPTCCLFVRRAVFEDVGLFDPRLISGGDKEFGRRVHAAAYDLEFAPEPTVYHPTRNSISALVNKDFRVGRGLCQLQHFHRDRYGSPGIPPRPSGIKYPRPTLPVRDRLAFGSIATFLTAVRGVGYYAEYFRNDWSTDVEAIPRLDA